MNIKVIAGIILVVLGIGSGVLEWFKSGFAAPYPAVGLIMTAIGIYLIINGLRKRKTGLLSLPKGSLPKEDVTLAALLLGIIGGTIAISKLKERASSVSREEIDEALKQLELLRVQGKITPDKYQELKTVLESARK